MTRESLIEIGHNAWKTAHAEKIGFIVDARDYFSAFLDAVSRAQESVLILAWDIDSRLRLLRDQDPDADSDEFAPLLAGVLDRRPDLNIHVLCWDFSTIYATERELLSQLKMDWMVHNRLHFRYDDNTSFCRRLREADHREKLRICYPEVAEGTWPNVHSKLTIVDDRWAYLGSANFANRSMGFDTECGLGLDGSDRDDVAWALRTLRRRLLAEHLDVEVADLASAEDELGMLGAIERLAGGGRTLKDLETDEAELAGMLEPVARLADPVHPVHFTELIDDFF